MDNSSEQAALILTERMLTLIKESGATKAEAFAALNAARALVPTLAVSHAQPRGTDPLKSLFDLDPDS